MYLWRLRSITGGAMPSLLEFVGGSKVQMVLLLPQTESTRVKHHNKGIFVLLLRLSRMPTTSLFWRDASYLMPVTSLCSVSIIKNHKFNKVTVMWKSTKNLSLRKPYLILTQDDLRDLQACKTFDFWASRIVWL